MLFMVIEKFRNQNADAVYRRLRGAKPEPCENW
jgi:hypothetical protein